MTKPKEKTIEELTAEIAVNERKIQQGKNRTKQYSQDCIHFLIPHAVLH